MPVWRKCSQITVGKMCIRAKGAGIKEIHVHQLRHTFGRMIADETGSLDEVQEAHGHCNRSTTRVYVQRITRKRDKHSRSISERLKKTA